MAVAPAGVIWGVSRDTAVRKRVPEWTKWRRGCGKVCCPSLGTPVPPEKALARQRKPRSFPLVLSLPCILVAFESHGQKLVKLITQGSVKIKVEVPAPYMPPSLLYEVRRFSDVLSSFLLLVFCTTPCSKVYEAPLKHRQQIRSTQTQLSLCLQTNLQLETELGTYGDLWILHYTSEKAVTPSLLQIICLEFRSQVIMHWKWGKEEKKCKGKPDQHFMMIAALITPSAKRAGFQVRALTCNIPITDRHISSGLKSWHKRSYSSRLKAIALRRASTRKCSFLNPCYIPNACAMTMSWKGWIFCLSQAWLI